MALTVAELDLLLAPVREVGRKVDDLTIAFAKHCAAEEAMAVELGRKRGSRAPWLAAGASWAAVAVALAAIFLR